jgi:heptosyltransferase-1
MKALDGGRQAHPLPVLIDVGPKPRILLIRLSAIGDVVVTTPVARALRATFPRAYLAWVVEPKAGEVLRRNPFLDEVITWQREPGSRLTRQAGAYAALRRELRQRRFDLAIDFQGLLRSGLVAWMSGARWRIGNTRCKEPAGWFYTHQVPRPTRTSSSRQRCLDLLRPLGVETEDRRMVVEMSEEDRAAAAAILEEAGLGADEPYACLVPATTWWHKHWLDARWAILADRLREEEGLKPVFMGAAADTARIGAIMGGMDGPAASLCARTSLLQAAAVLARARLVVAVDTGLLHIAAAVGAPLVGLCGASYWPGFQDYENLRLIHEPFPCSPCLHRPICRYVDCMQAIVTGDVLAACRQVMDRAPVPVP